MSDYDLVFEYPYYYPFENVPYATNYSVFSHIDDYGDSRRGLSTLMELDDGTIIETFGSNYNTIFLIILIIGLLYFVIL